MKDAAAMPTIATQHEFVEAGCERVRDFNRRAALYVDKLMRGAKPADLPIQQPTRFFVTINRRTADTLGPYYPVGIARAVRRDHRIRIRRATVSQGG
jgi:putative tryptophan/tyrosine transport system substrate-binding protein